MWVVVFFRARKILTLLILAIFFGMAAYISTITERNTPSEITTTVISNVAEGGRVIQGINLELNSTTLQTESKLVYESKEIFTNSKSANAAVLKWDEQESGSSPGNYALIQFRTHNGKDWSEWVDASSPEDRKDGTDAPHNALVLADVIKNIQYRFALSGKPDSPSPKINLGASSLELIDTSKGPSLDEQNKEGWLDKLTGLFTGTAGATSDSPYIYNRAQWGSPEAYSSPEWDPTYEPLHRITVHHTATTYSGDSFAAMRAIWHHHKNINGWGDIGYNYVVDSQGNMFQGRFYDYAEAERQHGEVVGAHAYEHNRGTSGISVIGNYATADPPSEVFYSVARLAAYKAAEYDFNPAYDNWFGPQLIGHRDVNQTACPGQRFYDRLQEVRNLANAYYPRYSSTEHLDHTYSGQGFNDVQISDVAMWPGTSGVAYIDMKNNGSEVWHNSDFGLTMLGTDAPQDRRSLFCTGSWLGGNCDRPATFTKKVIIDASGNRTTQAANAIARGEIARFEFPVTAPMVGGVYKEQFNLLSAQRSWFLQNKNVYFNFRVPAPLYEWAWQSQGIYTDQTATIPADLNDLRAGERVYFQIKAKNNGNQPWLRDGYNPLRLATNRQQDRRSWMCDPTWVNSRDCNRAATLQEARVDYGQIGTFGFWGVIPYGGAQDTVMREYFNLTAESKVWLNDVGAYWEFTVQGN